MKYDKRWKTEQKFGSKYSGKPAPWPPCEPSGRRRMGRGPTGEMRHSWVDLEINPQLLAIVNWGWIFDIAICCTLACGRVHATHQGWQLPLKVVTLFSFLVRKWLFRQELYSLLDFRSREETVGGWGWMKNQNDEKLIRTHVTLKIMKYWR